MIELQKQFQPKARNICSACGKGVGVSKLIVAGNINICFECADLSKQLADKKRNEVAEKEIQQMANDLSLVNINTEKGNFDIADTGMATAYMYAERLYKAGYRKVE